MAERGRYAPSPTGALHAGNARTALLAWLDARARGASFVLRMEDLDPERSIPAAAAGIVEDLRWLGLDWDEGPGTGGLHGPCEQSARTAIYQEAVERLLREGRAYECSCSRADVARASVAPHAGEEGPRYPGTCRAGPTQPGRLRSVRLRVEPGLVALDDLLLGERTFDVAAETGDFVIRRADGVAAYQLAVAVDDALMEITRVVRGDDLLSSTPRQLLVYRALGLAPPRFAHVPLVVGEDGHRLAKRGGALALQVLRGRGARPEAVVGLLAGTARVGDGRPVQARELIPGFALERVSRTPAVLTERDLSRVCPQQGAPDHS